MIKQFLGMINAEFKDYSRQKFIQDLMAGITVAAVAIPLALAFGVSSGTTAAAGLIAAIVAGVIISSLSSAFYQISGPTGAMAAILISLVAKYGMNGIFIATFMAGGPITRRNISFRKSHFTYSLTSDNRVYFWHCDHHR